MASATPTKTATAALIDAVGDGLADDTQALQTALDSAHVVEGNPEHFYRATKPLKIYPDTILLNIRFIVELESEDDVFLDWSGLRDSGVYMFGCEFLSKSPQGTVLLRLDSPIPETPQRSFLDLVKWSNAKSRVTGDKKFIEFYTYP